MKAVLKFLVIGTGLVLIALTLIALLLSARLEGFARAGLERGLSAGLGAPVTIAAIDAAPLQEAVILTGLRVGMPPGHGDGDMLSCERLFVSVKARSVMAGQPVIRLIRVEAPVLTVRHDAGRGINVVPLLGIEGREITLDGTDESAQPGFTIETIEVTEGMVRTQAADAGVTAGIPLPATTLTNVQAHSAFTAANVLQKALRAILGNAMTGPDPTLQRREGLAESLRNLVGNAQNPG